MILYNGLSKQELINKNYNHIYNHELAHKNAGGQFAGAITIERDENGIPVSGHVPIAMPVLDKKRPAFLLCGSLLNTGLPSSERSAGSSAE